MSWATIVRDLVAREPEGDSREIASKVLAALSHDDLVALVAEEVEHQQRLVARDQERTTLRPLHRGNVPTVAERLHRDESTEWKALMLTRFRLGDRRAVEWGAATVEQHEQRIAMLTKLRDGLDATITFHRDAIALLKVAGVRCLNDLPAVA